MLEFGTRRGRRCVCSRFLDICGVKTVVRRYHYTPRREICTGLLTVCRVDLVLRVGGAGGSRYAKSRKGWPV